MKYLLGPAYESQEELNNTAGWLSMRLDFSLG